MRLYVNRWWLIARFSTSQNIKDNKLTVIFGRLASKSTDSPSALVAAFCPSIKSEFSNDYRKCSNIFNT